MTSKFRALFDVQDMTTGSPMRNIVQFSVPLLIGNLAQQLYSTVDSIVVGRYVGDTALAAVGASGPVINLLIVLFVGISTGAGIMVSRISVQNKRAPVHNGGELRNPDADLCADHHGAGRIDHPPADDPAPYAG